MQVQEGGRRVTIKDIAARAGVSTATVSRVLNDPNYRCAKPGLRDEIWRIAMDMGYTPNEAARNLKLRTAPERTAFVQVLMTRAGAASENDPFFRELLRYVETEVTTSHCVLCDVQYRAELSDDARCARMDIASHVRAMREQAGESCDGIIVIGKCNRAVLAEVQQRYASAVAISRNSTDYAIDEVLCDGEKVAAVAVEHVLALGHTRIGYIGGCHNESRYRGYQSTLRAHGLDIIPAHVIETGQTEEEGYQAMRAFLQRDDAPTAMYCANDLTALGVLRCLGDVRHPGARPSVVASDDIEAAQACSPLLTTVRVPKREMAHLAVRLLLDRMRGGHAGPVRVEVEGTLVQRESCTPYTAQR